MLPKNAIVQVTKSESKDHYNLKFLYALLFTLPQDYDDHPFHNQFMEIMNGQAPSSDMLLALSQLVFELEQEQVGAMASGSPV